MHATDQDGQHAAYHYLDAGISLIPIHSGLKTPLVKWAEFMQRAPTYDEMQFWLQEYPDCNWAIVCGNGIGCGDVDDQSAADWILANPTSPLLQGACVVRSGRGRVHVWFRYPMDLKSSAWHLLPGRKMGEVRADKNYVLVPPSALAGWGPYQRVAGSFRTLPTIADPDGYLKGIVATYLSENPEQSVNGPNTTSKRILRLNAHQTSIVHSRVREAQFKGKVLDTLFKRGNQDPGTRHWDKLKDNSHSAIDFAICAEFIRKGWAFDDVEEVFACTLVGEACYQRETRANHGLSYLWSTYQNADADVMREKAAAAQAKGANFQVLEAVLFDTGDDKHYTLVIVKQPEDGIRYTVRVTAKQLGSETLFRDACQAQARLFPRFNANQTGRAFTFFSEAVDRMVTDITHPMEVLTDLGLLKSRIKTILNHIPKRDSEPQTKGEAHGLGWRVGDVYWVRLGTVVERLITSKAIDPKGGGVMVNRAISEIGHAVREPRYWPDVQESEEVLRITVQPAGRPPLRPVS